jgi:hypothetical protein
MSTISDEIRDELSELNPEAVVWDGFDEALIGYGSRCAMDTVAIYDYNKMIEILMREMLEQDAIEYLEFNIMSAWIGEGTPIIMNVMKRDDRDEAARLREGVEKFVAKNFHGGAKADREDYGSLVSAKDIYDLRELIRRG